MQLPTLKIVNPKKAAEFLIINEADFDPNIHIKWDERNDDRPKKKRGPKPKDEEPEKATETPEATNPEDFKV